MQTFAGSIQALFSLQKLAQKRAVVLFFVLFLILGVFVSKDYGTSWDEPMNIGFGAFTYNTISQFFNGQPMDEFTIGGRPDDHAATRGSTYELILYVFFKLIHVSDARPMFFIRHGINFIAFLIGVWLFYRIGRIQFGSRAWAVLGSTFLLLSPRIFADSFYNTVDILFMCLFIFNAFTLLKLMLRLNKIHLLLHVISSALLINCRSIGAITLAMTALFLLPHILNFRAQRDLAIKCAGYFALYLAMTLGLFIALTPYLWDKTLQRLWESLASSNQVMLRGTVLYMGRLVSVDNLPWHYNFVWILITTPPLYLVTFFIGTGMYLHSVFKTHQNILAPKSLTLFAIWFWLPLIAPVLLHTILYDAWRHHFFVYPAFIIFSVSGARFLLRQFQGLLKSLPRQKIIMTYCIVMSLALAQVGWVMIKYHPFQNVYFNFMAGDKANMQKRFDMDYWGLSYRKCLEYAFAHDRSPLLSIGIANFPVWCNTIFLKPKDKKRMAIESDLRKMNYFIGNFRGVPQGYPLADEFYSVKVDGMKISVVYRVPKLSAAFLKNI